MWEESNSNGSLWVGKVLCSLALRILCNLFFTDEQGFLDFHHLVSSDRSVCIISDKSAENTVITGKMENPAILAN